MYQSIKLTRTTSSRSTSISRSARRRRGISGSLILTATLALLLSATLTVFGGSATWNLNPTSGVWNTASNWTPATVPSEPADTATFGISNTTSITSDTLHDVDIDGIVFNPDASAFTISFANSSFNKSYSFNGVGIMNNSGVTQNLVVGDLRNVATLVFKNGATAGNHTVFSTSNGLSNILFQDSSTAGNATLNLAFGPIFQETSTAGNALLIGVISFEGDSTGGTASVELGALDISRHNAPGVTIGALNGGLSYGRVYLGANNLTVGSNNLHSTILGVIQDGGSLTKIGTGKLVLTNANTYTGGTAVEAGALVVNNTTGFGTGTGPVEVHAGILGGSGRIAGAVTVGTGAGAGAILSPGVTRPQPRTLTTQGPITLKSDSTYRVALNSTHAKADKIVANGGITIESSAHFTVLSSGQAVLTPGTLFTVIDNTSATPIAGTFANLADGATFSVNGNTYQASYEGGDGNDLTLTVQ